MSAAASPASAPRTPSSARHHQSYDRDRYQTAAAAAAAAPPTTTTTTTSPRRSLSQSQTQPQPTIATPTTSHSRNPSGVQPQQQLANVARRDFEQADVAVPPMPIREGSAIPTRSDSTRQAASGQPRARHDSQDMSAMVATAAAAAATAVPDLPANGGTTKNDATPHTASSGVRRRTTIDTTTGHWELGKTIGAGSMGKVKLARNKETGEQVAVKIVPRQSTDEHRSTQERERADHSKEVRTAREAAIVTLVDHPYICGMRDVLRTNYHWYMLFEYVNGGQMLDYIISHGRLKEKQARKFGRQIASALDYCHRNSIVHRDLKIENILISKTGDIKIIDFGLSNTFAPKSLLKTFCGSLYFAAPELLQAKAYVGPEVDVWSFGIVLYVLVCGKVPFDDQSMPQLHAKIKKGVVEYPPWLTAECRALIARMLVTDPLQRATLAEIMTHPWMTKGFGGPPENHLPSRRPLQLPLDPAVLQKMDGFDFGAAHVIEAKLTKILQSEDYQKALLLAERRSQMTPEIERRRGVFDFYKRRNSTASRDTLTGPSSEAVQLGVDPLNAYHPLISVYFLAKEKLEREAKETNPGALSIPSAHAGEKAVQPDLQPPQAAYTNTSAYEMAGEKPTGGRSRPRARTHGEDEIMDEARKAKANTRAAPPSPAIVLPPQEHTSVRKEGMASGLLRRFSTRRTRDSDRPVPSQSEHSTPRKSFSIRKQRDREPSVGALRPSRADGQAPDLLSPPSATDPVTRRIGLGRSTSVSTAENRRRSNRRGASEGSNIRPLMSPQHSSRRGNGDERIGDAASDVESTGPRNSALTSRTKSVGHSRKDSYQARRAYRGGYHDTEDVIEETDRDLQEDVEGNNIGGSGGDSPGMKPVYLKGLFSVSTTSSKPLNVIRADIIRTLQQLGVEYREIKGGFSCRHAPSIDLKKAEDGERGGSLSAPSAHKRKISFGGLMSGGGGGGGNNNGDRDNESRVPATPTGSKRRSASRNPENGYTASEGSYSEQEEDDDSEGNLGSRRRAARRSHAEYARAPGETSTHVQSDLGESMVLRFEIFVVKVPILNIHGIQFKKVDGGTWQYKNMAQTILNELRL